MSTPISRAPSKLTEEQECVLDFIEAVHVLLDSGKSAEDLVEIIRTICPPPVRPAGPVAQA